MKIIKFAYFFMTELILSSSASIGRWNNICRSYTGYLALSLTSDCYYSPDLYKVVPDVVERHIGVGETHEVTTDDGYILTLFRIPRNNSKGVVLLYHPLNTDSNIWVNQEEESFAFILWNSGFDVWMANNRGTYYSKKHVTLTPDDAKFWDFSFHEMGVFDMKANINYIRGKVNNRKVTVIGHSIGPTIGLVYSSLLPKESEESVEIFIHMAPIAYIKSIPDYAIALAPFFSIVKWINSVLGQYRLMAYDDPFFRIGRILAIAFPVKFVFSLIISIYCGWSPLQYDPRFYNLMFSVFPSEMSWKIFYHFAQIAGDKGDFRMYDYGKKKNKELYGEEKPPFYPVANITTPTYLIYSTEDSLGNPKDTEFLYNQLQDGAKIYGKMEISGLNHIDYHYGRDRIDILYDKVIAVIDAITLPNND